MTLARYRGKVVLLTFGFTNCAAVCPTTLATLAQARSSLGEAADAVQVIFVTVDPERDDAAHMRDYLAAFDPSFVGATGAPDALAAVRQNYGVTAVKHGTGADYAMAHTSSIFLIDRAGKLRAMMPFGHDAADFVHDIKLLLASDARRMRRRPRKLSVRAAGRDRRDACWSRLRCRCSCSAGLAGPRWRRSTWLRTTSCSRFRAAPRRAAWPAKRSRSCRRRSG